MLRTGEISWATVATLTGNQLTVTTELDYRARGRAFEETSEASSHKNLVWADLRR